MSLARRDREVYRQATLIGYGMDLRGQTAPASPKTAIGVTFFKVAAEWWTRTLVPSIARQAVACKRRKGIIRRLPS